MSQSTDDLTRSELSSHPRPLQLDDESRRGPLAWARTGSFRTWPARVPAVAVGIEAWAARSSATTTCRSHDSATRLSSARLR
jgi:hypothetical protein